MEKKFKIWLNKIYSLVDSSVCVYFGKNQRKEITQNKA